MYADFEYYSTVYMGKEIAGDDFPRLSTRASAYLNTISSAEKHQSDDAVRLAVCAVAEAWQRNEAGGEVVSQSVGIWSKTYATGATRTKEQALMDAARMYLSPVGLMRAVGWA